MIFIKRRPLVQQGRVQKSIFGFFFDFFDTGSNSESELEEAEVKDDAESELLTVFNAQGRVRIFLQ